jgi:N-methylhydantoinase B
LLQRGDRIVVRTGGGGGWGDPRARDPAAVARDVGDDLITIADAATYYGVVIDPETRRVDDASTARLREKAHQKAWQ